MVEKTVAPDQVSAKELSKLPPNKITNIDKNITVISTVIGWVFASTIFLWLCYCYSEYTKYLADSKYPLPETGIVKTGIPIFFTAIVLEYVASRIIGLDSYRLNDSVCSLGTGLLQQIVEVITGLVSYAIGVTLITAIPYSWIHENYRIASITGLPGFIGLFLMRDFGYYWFHRAGHRVAFMWAVHGVHHRPNEFNYTVSLSQGALQRWTEIVFYAPMALFFPLELYILLYPIAKIYGFFTHTRIFSGMWGLDFMLITPSDHRVHHASAPSLYIDKNYGEVFNIWDRMFGTYQKESFPVVYGTVEPHTTWDPVEANLEIWRKLFEKAEKCTTFKDKVLVFLLSPGWNPEDENGEEYPLPDTTPWSSQKFDSTLSWGLTLYTLFNYLITLVVGIILLQGFERMDTKVLLVLFVAVTISLKSLGKLWDRSENTFAYELLRHLVIVGLTFYFAKEYLLHAAGYSFVSLLYLYSNGRYFKKETQKQWEDRVMVPSAGREFGDKLKKDK